MPKQEITVYDRWVDTGRGRLLARCWSAAGCVGGTDDLPSIILFHDSLGSIELWRSFPALLAEQTGRKVVAYDRLGFGQSDARTDRIGFDFIAEEARLYFPLLREQLEIGRFIAFGHSVGGAMAAHCAALHGPSCAALITESAQAFVEEKTRAGIREAQEMFKQPDAFARLQKYHGQKTRWVLDSWIDTWLSPEFADWSLKPALAGVTCPTLVIHGSEDEYGSHLQAEAIAQSVRGRGRLEMLSGVRHVPHREQEQLVARQVKDFVESSITAACSSG